MNKRRFTRILLALSCFLLALNFFDCREARAQINKRQRLLKQAVDKYNVPGAVFAEARDDSAARPSR